MTIFYEKRHYVCRPRVINVEQASLAGVTDKILTMMFDGMGDKDESAGQ